MPVTVGALTNVPAPNDPIRSPWAQQASGYVVHPFASLAALNAGWSTAPNGSVAVALDTSVMYLRRASAWEPVVPRPAPYTALSAVGQTGIVAAVVDIAGLAVGPITAIAGHRYLITVSLTVQQNPAGTFGLYITDGTNAIKQQAFATIVAAGYQVMTSVVVDAPTAGAITYKARGNTNAGAASINQGVGAPSMLIVQDLGP